MVRDFTAVASIPLQAFLSTRVGTGLKVAVVKMIVSFPPQEQG